MEAKKLNKDDFVLNYLYKNSYDYKQAQTIFKLIKNHINDYDMITKNVCEGDDIVTVQALFKKSYGVKPVFNGFTVLKGIIIKDELKNKEHIFTIKINNLDGGYQLEKIKEKNVYKYICIRKEWQNEEIRKFFVERKENSNKGDENV